MSDAGDPDAAEDDSSRRRLLVLLGSGLLAVVGAGFGTSPRFDDDPASDPDLSIEYDVTADRPPSSTPTPAGEATDADPTPAPDTPVDDGGSTERPSDPTADGSPADGSGWLDGDRDPPPAGTGTAVSPDDPVAAAVPPLDLDDVAPGDGGTVDLSLSLSGSPARLWVRGTVTDVAEGGVTDAERSAGDGGPPGELQEYVRVRLWYDDTDGRPVYEGSLAGLDAVSGWIPLTDACVAAGAHAVRFRWELPADAPNRVQTDSVSFSLGVAADAGEC
jgi:hypothetical protein